MERKRRMRRAPAGAPHSFTVLDRASVREGEAGNLAGGAPPAPCVGVRSLRRLGGALLMWAWVGAMLFMVGLIQLAPGAGIAYRGVQTAALGGVGIGLAVLACAGPAARRALLGRAGRAAALALAVASSALLVAVRFEPWSSGAGIPVRMALWLVEGLCGAHAIWCGLGTVAGACHEVRATARRGEADRRGWGWSCLGLCSEIALASSLLNVLASRADSLGATVYIVSLVPLALLALPLPRPSDEDAIRPAGRAAGTAPLLLTLAAIGLTCGFHIVMGSVLYAGNLYPPTGACLCVAAAALVARFLLTPLPSPRRTVVLQGLLCLMVVVFVPLLFLEASPLNAFWWLCQSALVALSACAFLLAVSAAIAGTAQACERTELEAHALPGTGEAASAGAGGAKPAGAGGRRGLLSRPDLCAFALFFIGISLGWLMGTLVGWNFGVGSTAFKVAVTVAVTLLLVSIVSLGTLRSAQVAAETWSRATLDARATGSVPAVSDAPRPARPVGERAVDGPYALLAERYGLSERERELLEPLVSGRTAQQIANDLMVSRNTIKSHMAHIYTKLGIHTRGELIEIVEQMRAAYADTAGADGAVGTPQDSDDGGLGTAGATDSNDGDRTPGIATEPTAGRA